MQIEGAYITKVIKLKEYVEHADDPLMQIVRTHQHNTSSTLFHTVTNLQKSLQSDTKQIKTTIARKDGKQKDCMDSCHGAWMKD
jgi:hypothetical protein